MASHASRDIFSPMLSSPAAKDALRTRLAELDAEIAQLQTKLNRLVVAREPIAQVLGSLVYSIATLPPDIAGEIFMQYKAEDEGYLDSMHRGPHLLARVCRQWRHITLNLPSLWSTLHIPHITNPYGAQKLLELWLFRVGGHPLELETSGLSYSDTEILAPTLAPYVAQCRSLSCWLPSPLLTHQMVGDGPLGLKKLTLRGHFGDEENPPAPLDFSADAPQLREAALTNIPLERISLPWTQLTRLVCCAQTVTQCLDVLHCTPNLETLLVSSQDWLFRPGDAHFSPVCLDYLIKLELNTNWTLGLLDFIVLPALQYLDILLCGEGWDVDLALQRLLAFCARSQFSLRVLSLSFVFEFEPFPVMTLLQAMPTITEFHLVRCSRLDLTTFFNNIATDPSFLPNMQSLHIEKSREMVPYPEVCAMLMARWYHEGTDCAQLRSFRLIRGVSYDYDVPVDPVISGKLLALVDEGMKIHIESLHERKSTERIDYVVNSASPRLRHSLI
jgi:hypothetical protein